MSKLFRVCASKYVLWGETQESRFVLCSPLTPLSLCLYVHHVQCLQRPEGALALLKLELQVVHELPNVGTGN